MLKLNHHRWRSLVLKKKFSCLIQSSQIKKRNPFWSNDFIKTGDSFGETSSPIHARQDKSWCGMNRGSSCLRNCRHFNKVITPERALFLQKRVRRKILYKWIYYLKLRLIATIIIIIPRKNIGPMFPVK